MKFLTRFFPALLVALFIASAASAQVGIGFRAGVLSSNQTAKQVINGQEEEFDTDNITGYVIGIPVELGLSKVLSFQTELNYLKQGYGLAENKASFIPETKVSYDVFEIPVLAKVGWTSDKVSIAAVVGPSFQYVASGRVEIEALSGDLISIQSSDEKIDFSQSVYDDFNRTNFYGQAGVQLGVPIAAGKFVFDARYRFALNDQDSSDDYEVKGHGVSATLGYIHTFGKY